MRYISIFSAHLRSWVPKHIMADQTSKQNRWMNFVLPGRRRASVILKFRLKYSLFVWPKSNLLILFAQDFVVVVVIRQISFYIYLCDAFVDLKKMSLKFLFTIYLWKQGISLFCHVTLPPFSWYCMAMWVSEWWGVVFLYCHIFCSPLSQLFIVLSHICFLCSLQKKKKKKSAETKFRVQTKQFLFFVIRTDCISFL